MGNRREVLKRMFLSLTYYKLWYGKGNGIAGRGGEGEVPGRMYYLTTLKIITEDTWPPNK